MKSGAYEQALPPPASPSKREAVLRAALELFTERTFGATPVPDIACRARVGAGTIRAGLPGVLIALVFGAFVGMIKESEQGRFELSEKTIEQAGETAWRMLATL